jgi:hypothetical protein
MRLLIKLRMTISVIVKANSELFHCSFRVQPQLYSLQCNFTLQQAGQLTNSRIVWTIRLFIKSSATSKHPHTIL